MAIKNRDGQITETPEEARQAENSPDTFFMLIISLVVLAVIGAVLLWYFGVVKMS
jgi:hypothetical protein